MMVIIIACTPSIWHQICLIQLNIAIFKQYDNIANDCRMMMIMRKVNTDFDI